MLGSEERLEEWEALPEEERLWGESWLEKWVTRSRHLLGLGIAPEEILVVIPEGSRGELLVQVRVLVPEHSQALYREWEERLAA